MFRDLLEKANGDADQQRNIARAYDVHSELRL